MKHLTRMAYGFATNSSHLIASVTGPADILVTNTWETDRNVLADKKNEVDTDNISQYTYYVNNLCQRTGAADRNLLADAGINAMAYGLKFEWDAERCDQKGSIMDGGGAAARRVSHAMPRMANQNRLTTVRKADDTLLATYDNDHMGRRIRKTTTADAYQGASDIAYLYDGWNVVAEYSISAGPSIALTQAYTWRLDLSGSLQGAGGVGGLLCIHRGPGLDGSGDRTWTDSFYPTYDGNGNVSEYLDNIGDEVAHFEYDPFGRLAATTGTPADFTCRFSTKPQDFETGLFYYGYRYYDPVTGRWPSRDPIEEEGGINLYAFVGNDGVNRWDFLGMKFGCKYPCIFRKIQAAHAYGYIECDDGFKFIWSFGHKIDPYTFVYRGFFATALESEWYFIGDTPNGFNGSKIGLWKDEARKIEQHVRQLQKDKTFLWGIDPLDFRQITCQGAAILPVRKVIGNWESSKREFEAMGWDEEKCRCE